MTSILSLVAEALKLLLVVTVRFRGSLIPFECREDHAGRVSTESYGNLGALWDRATHPVESRSLRVACDGCHNV